MNYEDPGNYHFYFGNETGAPGTIFTSFPYGSELQLGRHGKDKINSTAFSLPFESLAYWQERLDKYHTPHKHPQKRYESEVFIYLEDPDGLGLELVFTDKETRAGDLNNKNIPQAHTIRGIHHVELWLNQFEKTAALLTMVMNHHLISESAGRFRYGVQDVPGKLVDIVWDIEGFRGLSGRGMIHHVAFATPDAATQGKIMEKLKAFGLQTTAIKDRKYFTSFYFTLPQGVIFEVATLKPGFTIDEGIEELGTKLQLPQQFESNRTHLTTSLPQFNDPTENYK